MHTTKVQDVCHQLKLNMGSPKYVVLWLNLPHVRAQFIQLTGGVEPSEEHYCMNSILNRIIKNYIPPSADFIGAHEIYITTNLSTVCRLKPEVSRI